MSSKRDAKEIPKRVLRARDPGPSKHCDEAHELVDDNELSTSASGSKVYSKRALADLQRIPGVGCVHLTVQCSGMHSPTHSPAKAKKFIDLGCWSVSDLRNRPELASMLTQAGRAALDYVEFLNIQVNRQTADLMLVCLVCSLRMGADHCH